MNPVPSQLFKPVQAGVFEHGFGDAWHDSARFIDVHLRFPQSFNSIFQFINEPEGQAALAAEFQLLME